MHTVPVPVAARSKAYICGLSPAEIVGSNPTGGMDVCPLWVLSVRGLCDELITRPEESYRLRYVVECGLETSWMRRPWPTGGGGGYRAKNKQTNWYVYGSGSSVGIATELRAGRSRIESRWGRDFPPVQTGPGSHPASCKMRTGSFPRGKVRPGHAADRGHGRVELYLYPPSGPHRACKGITLPLPWLTHVTVLLVTYQCKGVLLRW